jgi:hypothetical protein
MGNMGLYFFHNNHKSWHWLESIIFIGDKSDKRKVKYICVLQRAIFARSFHFFSSQMQVNPNPGQFWMSYSNGFSGYYLSWSLFPERVIKYCVALLFYVFFILSFRPSVWWSKKRQSFSFHSHIILEILKNPRLNSIYADCRCSPSHLSLRFTDSVQRLICPNKLVKFGNLTDHFEPEIAPHHNSVHFEIPKLNLHVKPSKL